MTYEATYISNLYYRNKLITVYYLKPNNTQLKANYIVDVTVFGKALLVAILEIAVCGSVPRKNKKYIGIISNAHG